MWCDMNCEINLSFRWEDMATLITATGLCPSFSNVAGVAGRRMGAVEIPPMGVEEYQH